MPPNPPRRSLPRRLWIAVSLMLTGCASLAPLPTTKPQLPPPPPVVTLTRLGGQPLVGAREALTVENIGQAKTLATLGNGALYSAMWNGNGDIIIDTALGLTRYAVPQQLCCDDLGPQLPLRLLAALPGNRLLLAGAYGADAHRPLTVWNMVTNQTSRLPIASARNVVASADGALLALDSEVTVTPAPNALPLAESRLVILDSAGRTLQTFINKPYTQLAFSHDGQRIAIATTEADGPPPTVVVELVDLATGQMVQTLRGFQYVVDDLAFIPGSANMLVRENGGATSVWDTASGQKLRDLGQTDAIAVAPDGRLAAAMRESTIVRWQTSDWAEMPPLPTTAAITMALAATPTLRNQTRLAFAPDSRRLLALGGTDLVVWQMDGTAVPVLLPFSGRLGKVAFAPNGATLATAGFDMRLWDLASGAVRQRQIASVPAFAFSPDGATMWLTVRGSGSNDELRVLDIASGQMRPLPQTPAPGNLAFSPAGSSVVARDDNIKQWDATTGALLREFEARPTLSGALSGVAGGSTPMFSPDGRLLAAGVDEQVRVWDAATGQELRRFVHPSSMSRVQQVLFSPDSTLVASLALDSVILREVDSGREQRQLRLSDPQRFFSSIAFSPDGTLLAAGTYLNGDPSGTSELKVWEVATGRELATFAGHTEAVFSVAFSPDGRLLASASADGTVRIVGR